MIRLLFLTIFIFLTNAQDDHVIAVDSTSLARLVDQLPADGRLFLSFIAPWCGHSKRLAPNWDAAATSLATQAHLQFGRVDCTQDKFLCEVFDITGYPTQLLVHRGKDDAVRWYEYAGKTDALTLARFIQSPSPDSSSSATPFTRDVNLDLLAAGAASATRASGSSGTAVLPLATQADLDGLLARVAEAQGAGRILVEFYLPACRHCIAAAPEFDKASVALKAKATLSGKVNCEDGSAISMCAAFGVRAFPTFVLYADGKWVDFGDSAVTADALVDFATADDLSDRTRRVLLPSSGVPAVDTRIHALIADLTELQAARPDAVACIFTAGFLVGSIVTKCMRTNK